MLRNPTALLLSRSGLQQAAAAASWGQQCSGSGSSGSSSSWAPTRGKSDAAADPAAGGLLQQQQLPSEMSLDLLPPSEVLAAADQLSEVAQVAAESVVAAAKGSTWLGTRSFIDLFMWSHDSLGVPWFEAIVISNLVIKMLSLPLTYTSQKQAPAMQAMRADSERLQQLGLKVSQAKTASEYEMRVSEYKDAMDEVRRRNKGKAFKTLLLPVLTVAQMTVFISQFSAVNTLARDKLPSMTLEGTAWFSDLTLPDPFWGLPVICAAATLAMLNSTSMMESMQGPTGKTMKKVMTFMALIIVPLGGTVPSAVALLWASNAILTVVQNQLMANPGVRQVLGLPPSQAVNSAASDWFSKLVAQQTAPPAQAAGAAAAAAPPPPGTKPAGLAVNYLSHKPRRSSRGKT